MSIDSATPTKEGAILTINPQSLIDAIGVDLSVNDKKEENESNFTNVIRTLEDLNVFFSTSNDGQDYITTKKKLLNSLSSAIDDYFAHLDVVAKSDNSNLNSGFIHDSLADAKTLEEELNTNKEENIIIAKFKKDMSTWHSIVKDDLDKAKIFISNKKKILNSPIVCNFIAKENYEWIAEVESFKGLKDKMDDLEYAHLLEASSGYINKIISQEVDKALELRRQLQEDIIAKLRDSNSEASTFNEESIQEIITESFLNINRSINSVWTTSAYSLTNLSGHYFKHTKLYKFMEQKLLPIFSSWSKKITQVASNLTEEEYLLAIKEKVKDFVNGLISGKEVSNSIDLTMFFKKNDIPLSELRKIRGNISPIFENTQEKSPYEIRDGRVYALTFFSKLGEDFLLSGLQKASNLNIDPNSRDIEAIKVDHSVSSLFKGSELSSKREGVSIKDNLALVSYRYNG